MAAKQILYLTPQLPFPPEQGTSLRNYNLITQVASRHEVSVLSLAHGAGGDPGPLARTCRIVRCVGMDGRSMRDRLYVLLRTRDPDMAHRLYHPAFAQALRELLQEERFDIVEIEGIEMARYGLTIKEWLGSRAPAIVFVDHNAEYLLQCRAFLTDLRRPRRWPAAAYSLVQWRRLCRFERRICELADAVLAVSPADAGALRRLVPGLRPLIIPNGVDTARYHPELPDAVPLQHPALVFTGKMDFRPNVDAILWFQRRVWPLVLEQVPQATLYIVGKNPDRALLSALSGQEGVRVTGYVPDILPYFGGADVYVVPLRIGGGTRLKVLEAMAAGLPIVSTTLGAEGIALTPGKHALLADAPEAFAQAIADLLGDARRAKALGAAARAFAVEHYDWVRIVPELSDLYERL